MISVDEARALVLALAPAPRPETIPTVEALGRALLAPAVARLTQPPFDAAAMDGYCLHEADLPGPVRVIGTAAAGRPWPGELPRGAALRILTGAPVPAGADRVVMQEIVDREGDMITVRETPRSPHIRPRGSDFAQGARFLPGRPLRPSDLGLIAAMNVPELEVARRPRVAILAGGDELVAPGSDPAPGQIVSSNDIAVAALAREAGAIPTILPLARDSEESLRARLSEAQGADLVVTIGGASVGDHDLIARVAADLGMERSFHRVAMRPGKPLMAGRLAGAAMLGLPGNPVSAIVCAKIFMQPLIRAMQGLPPGPATARATLAVDLPPEGDRRHYLRAALTPGAGLPRIAPFPDQDSARLWLLAQADALLVRPAHDPARPAGCEVDFIAL